MDNKFQNKRNLELEDVLIALFPEQAEKLPDVHIYLKANFFDLFENNCSYNKICNIHTKQQLLGFPPDKMMDLVSCLPRGKRCEFLKWVHEGEKGREKLQSYSCEDVYYLLTSISQKDRLEFFKMAVSLEKFNTWVEDETSRL